MIPRCREQMDQCCYPDGTRCTDAVAVKVPDRHAYECPVCGRRYPAMFAHAYADTVLALDE